MLLIFLEDENRNMGKIFNIFFLDIYNIGIIGVNMFKICYYYILFYLKLFF